MFKKKESSFDQPGGFYEHSFTICADVRGALA